MFCTSQWLDAKKIMHLEYSKLVGILIGFCYLYFFSPEFFLLNILMIMQVQQDCMKVEGLCNVLHNSPSPHQDEEGKMEVVICKNCYISLSTYDAK